MRCMKQGFCPEFSSSIAFEVGICVGKDQICVNCTPYVIVSIVGTKGMNSSLYKSTPDKMYF